jgi:hypothetical protein
MPREKVTSVPSFGYLSTLVSTDYGHFGGNLIVSPLGRPLEFHCTSPVRPSRAQEILYGPTLQPYLVGEQIGSALLKAAKLSPCLILVDVAAMLWARPIANSPMALVLPRSQPPACQDIDFANGQHASRISDADTQLEAGGYTLILPRGFECEKIAVAELATLLSQHVDLAEPFGRIHQAIREAQRIGERSAAARGQAA